MLWCPAIHEILVPSLLGHGAFYQFQKKCGLCIKKNLSTFPKWVFLLLTIYYFSQVMHSIYIYIYRTLLYGVYFMFIQFILIFVFMDWIVNFLDHTYCMLMSISTYHTLKHTHIWREIERENTDTHSAIYVSLRREKTLPQQLKH